MIKIDQKIFGEVLWVLSLISLLLSRNGRISPLSAYRGGVRIQQTELCFAQPRPGQSLLSLAQSHFLWPSPTPPGQSLPPWPSPCSPWPSPPAPLCSVLLLRQSQSSCSPWPSPCSPRPSPCSPWTCACSPWD